MSRPAIAQIRLDAFRHNYRVAKQLHGGKALAVVKANAYGHGAVKCAQAIANEADGFAVAAIEEALQLRAAGIQNPILLLEGFFEATELPLIVQHDLWIVVHADWQAEVLLNAELAKPVQVWLKMDSGMHRVGLSPSAFAKAYAALKNHENVTNLVLMTHFANADNLHSNHTEQQVALFKNTIAACADTTTALSLSNSAAILAWPLAHGDWSRPGIMLYGADPLLTDMHVLRPVMQLISRIIAIQSVKKGEAIGYGSIFTAKRDTRIGVVACGYADGYPRSASPESGITAPAAVNGMMTQVIGRVSMDMLFVDVTDIADAQVGSAVELWGDTVSANLVAKAAGTIAYELFCNVKRVQFNYSDD